ncbi:hypothetical protein [Sporosarcina koreensis]|uniref:hypothetical protein n=1 Tax=Sporosarcina koreensis TaxID=334735 RepID=UPI0007586C2F|nr:hypothetical protein [Sporosarcina koreensis]
MFNRWRERRIIKRMQAQCTHDWHELRTYKVDSGKYLTRFDWINYYDVFCPICEKTEYEVSEAEMTRIEQKRRIRRLHALKQTEEFRKGDVVTCRD